ncbi:MAG TPA: sterol desaturase family protein [candidate division Zixibacteria bacterium]|nr:sterol desaturase family protein [candidate division Zixibacteria bacterium]
MYRAFYPYVVFWGLGLAATAVEWRFRARSVPYRRVILPDLAALVLYDVFFMLAVLLTDRIPVPHAPATVSAVPLPYRLAVFLIVEDFGLYWVHRLMHTKYFWRTHMWHHSPNYMYWLAGIRATIPHVILFNLAFVASRPILHGAPFWVFQLIMAEHVFRNDWMHMNVSWSSRWLEWVVVTPRYHHIHHSDDPQHYRSNLGSLLTVWDRLFGTYYDPERATKELTFGIGTRVNPLRLVLGV